MEITALVPMKGHSERVPGKNLRPFCERPLYHWIIESLKKCKYVKRIAINTDSELIASDALKIFEVNIIKRPGYLVGDFVPMNDIIKYDLTQLEGEYFLQTHSTNPLLTTKTIDKAIECYFENLTDFDSLFSVTHMQSRLYWQNGQPINHNPHELLRTQDLPPVFEENSNIYIFSRKSFALSNNRIGLQPRVFQINRLEAVDIDEEQDFLFAELLFKLKNKLFTGEEL